MIKAVQQIQLGSVMGTEEAALHVMQLMKESGYQGIELNGFMIKRMPFIVRALTRMAGMPIGKTGRLNWKNLISQADLSVVSVHEDLGSILNHTDMIIEEAESFHTKNIVITGMHHFDYSDLSEVKSLIHNLNLAGKMLSSAEINLLYHNHNCEFQHVEKNRTAYDLIMAETDPDYVNFEFDSYWPAEAGVDVIWLMKKLGSRMKLYHINDRGIRPKGKSESIMKSNCMELGYGNMNLKGMLNQADENGVDAVILETHQNWVDNSPIKSFQLSSQFLNEMIP